MGGEYLFAVIVSGPYFLGAYVTEVWNADRGCLIARITNADLAPGWEGNDPNERPKSVQMTHLILGRSSSSALFLIITLITEDEDMRLHQPMR